MQVKNSMLIRQKMNELGVRIIVYYKVYDKARKLAVWYFDSIDDDAPMKQIDIDIDPSEYHNFYSNHISNADDQLKDNCEHRHFGHRYLKFVSENILTVIANVEMALNKKVHIDQERIDNYRRTLIYKVISHSGNTSYSHYDECRKFIRYLKVMTIHHIGGWGKKSCYSVGWIKYLNETTCKPTDALAIEFYIHTHYNHQEILECIDKHGNIISTFAQYVIKVDSELPHKSMEIRDIVLYHGNIRIVFV